ncbi:MAG TPA: sulfite exporter TauE/SafE family protein [Thermococcus sp.]|nr:sulfite exporter TauE/SafE family protein [Thermococcus sp.]
MEKLLIIPIALFGGFIGSLMSGGSLIVFFILTSLGLPVKVAVGTLKIVIAGLTLVSTLTYYREGVLELRRASLLTASSLLGAYLGSLLFLNVPDWLAKILVTLTLTAGLYFTLRRESGEERPLKGRYLEIPVGLALGFYIGILGEASTLVVISALGLFFRLDLLRANATAKLLIFATNTVAFLSYASKGAVDYSLGITIMVPVMVGSWLGAKVAVKLDPRVLRAVFFILAALTILNLLGWN